MYVCMYVSPSLSVCMCNNLLPSSSLFYESVQDNGGVRHRIQQQRKESERTEKIGTSLCISYLLLSSPPPPPPPPQQQQQHIRYKLKENEIFWTAKNQRY